MLRLSYTTAATAWENLTWEEFPAAARSRPGRPAVKRRGLVRPPANALVVLPLHGFTDHGLGLPLDAEEALAGPVIAAAADAVRGTTPAAKLLVLPPLRQVRGPHAFDLCGVDAATFERQLLEIATSVRDAGFSRLCVVNTNPWTTEALDAAARDSRVALGLDIFLIEGGAFGLDFTPPGGPHSLPVLRLARHLGLTGTRSESGSQAVTEPARVRTPLRPFPLSSPGLFHAPASSLKGGEQTFADCSARLTALFRLVLGGPAPKRPAKTPPPSAPALRGDRRRSLAALTADQLARLPASQRRSSVLLLPIGAIEQHGPHLPVGVDSFLGRLWTERLLAALPEADRARVWTLPPILYGKSNEHTLFPGTVSISATTLRALLHAMAAQTDALGFGGLVLLNSHGGNSAVLADALRELAPHLRCHCGLLRHGAELPVDALEAAFGFHAGEVETSWMLAAFPELVREGRAVKEFPKGAHPDALLKPENAPATYSWATQDLSKSGVLGDPHKATAAKGRRWIEAVASGYATHLQAFLHEGLGS